ncbi:MAG: potassium-transporting ATPase subunit KdpA [Candidatus Wallbacteria bacterium]|nr:potassium-transporting ATPase subunit KdpA [Candidatus Wallbacteria bacterium]
MDNDLLQISLYVACLIALTPLTGIYMARVFEGKLSSIPLLGYPERLFYKICGVKPEVETGWKEYAGNLLIFNLIGLIVLFLLQLFQSRLPLNPNHAADVEWTLAFNTAVSFVTNTNWQSYAGETAMGNLVQMAGFCVQNFLSAATGMAAAVALFRGVIRNNTRIGNFWVDMTRATTYILLPLSLVLALVLVQQGVVQSFSANQEATTLEGVKQIIPMGPAASQIAIKQLGTNGGGFFNANSAHPFENPTPLSNFIEMLAILMLPAGFVYTYGVMVNQKKHAWVLYSVMMVIFLTGLSVSLWSEYKAGGVVGRIAMEGKETRFGTANSILWSCATTAASNGSVNAMQESLSPLSGSVALFNMLLGEIIFGGLGCGMYGMLLFVLLAIFISGLMVGRTPEYLGKKIERKEIQLVCIGIIAPSAVILLGTALACVLPAALSSLSAKGPHGFSEILYAFTSAAANNGSAFAGLTANTKFYNLSLGISMLIGRFAVMLPCLALAECLAVKQSVPASSGTLPVNNLVFALLLIGVILIVGALTFLPSLVLGPVVDHLLFLNGGLKF